LLPLGDVPILEVVLQQLAISGFNRVVLTLGHMAHLFVATIGNGQRWNLHIEYCREDEPLGTAGPLRLIEKLDENFLVMNGDLLTTLDYQALFNRHCMEKAWGTIALKRREVHIDYGVVETDSDGLLRSYIEKPKIPYWVSMGVNVLNRRCLDFIPREGKFDMPELMLAMRNNGKPVVCHLTDCYWQDIGRFDDYQKASDDFVNNPDRFISGSRQA
jgi:NDP-sugar pyrophosphorylase family protein